MTHTKQNLIISLGGSLISTDEGLDVDFMKDFKELIEQEIQERDKVFIICGGGKMARNYVKSAQSISSLSLEEADWLGIYATRLNAYFLKTLFPEELVYSNLLRSPEEEIDTDKKIILAGGYKPGRSTDCMAVELARVHQVKTIVSLSNIEFLYDKDPNEHEDAKKITNISWQKYRDMTGSTWTPGLNTPFDPEASKMAQENNLQVFLTKGKPLTNLKNFCQKHEVKGTIIK